MKDHLHFKRTVRMCCFVLGLVFAAVPSFSATQPRPAWEWTLEERLTERFDPRKIKERDEAYIEANAATHPELRSEQGNPPQNRVRYGIDGARNPELFLPHELFDYLAKGVGSEAWLRSQVRQHFAGHLRSVGFDPDEFWPALESVATPYLPWVERRGSLTVGERNDKCHARYAALEAARDRFGRAEFDRMLYTVVAPAMQFSAATNLPDPGVDLRREAMGCQDSVRSTSPARP
jgi:hypothetical protein